MRTILTAGRDLQELEFKISTSWISGPEGIPGNERIDQSTRASLSHIRHQDSAEDIATTTITTVPDIGELVVEYQDKNSSGGEDYDNEEATILAKAERRATERLPGPREK